MAISLRERKAQGAARLMSAVPTNEVMGDMVDTVHDRILLTQIKPDPNQPRQGVDETSQQFDDLVGSIRQQGLIQPICLRQLDDGEEYVIIAGERRWRAFRRLAEERPAEYARIPATVTRLLGGDPGARALMMALIENVVREDLKDGERADALARLKRTTGWTYEQIAERMGMSVNRIQGLAALARHDVVREAVDDGRITQGQGMAIGQGVPRDDGALAEELVKSVHDVPPAQVRAVVREARRAPSALPAADRVQRARGKVLVGAAPPHERTDGYNVTAGGETVGRVDTPMVLIGATSLRVLRPRLTEMTKEDFAELLQMTCEETDVWPQRP